VLETEEYFVNFLAHYVESPVDQCTGLSASPVVRSFWRSCHW